MDAVSPAYGPACLLYCNPSSSLSLTPSTALSPQPSPLVQSIVYTVKMRLYTAPPSFFSFLPTPRSCLRLLYYGCESHIRVAWSSTLVTGIATSGSVRPSPQQERTLHGENGSGSMHETDKDVQVSSPHLSIFVPR